MGRKIEHVRIHELSKSFRTGTESVEVLRQVNLTVARGEFLTLFGPNGCGKTTLVNVVAGLEKPDAGTVTIDSGKDGAEISYVFQSYRETLMPWLDVARNITFPLRVRGVPRKGRRRKLDSLLERFEVSLDLKARPYNLSGGQAQMVSLLRGLITDPHLLVLDEPFSALDYQTVLSLYDQILDIWRRTGVTTIFISHNIDEALYLGDRTVFLTRRPAQIAEILTNDLPRPRSLAMMGTPEFAALKRRALEIFTQECGNSDEGEPPGRIAGHEPTKSGTEPEKGDPNADD